MSGNHQKYADFIWSVADLLRGDYRQSEYGKVILPFTVLRRIDCVLEPTKKDVLAEAERLKGQLLPPRMIEIKLRNASGASFYNTSPLTFGGMGADSDNVARNLRSYIGKFSPAPSRCWRSTASTSRSPGCRSRGCSTW